MSKSVHEFYQLTPEEKARMSETDIEEHNKRVEKLVRLEKYGPLISSIVASIITALIVVMILYLRN
jgi:hypothetical protein